MIAYSNRKKPILAVKLRNEILKQISGDNISVSLRNISINGNKKGCSGFITNSENGTCVWLSTDNEYCRQPIVYRYAKNISDYHGGINRWCDTAFDLAYAIKKMLTEPDIEWQNHFATTA